jgi:hypothetical protein
LVKFLLLLVCFISIPLWSTDYSVGLEHSESESHFGFGLKSRITIDTLDLSAYYDDFYISAYIPYAKLEGPAAIVGILPTRDRVLFSSNRVDTYLDAIVNNSAASVSNSEVSGLSDVTLSSGYYLNDSLFDNYLLTLSLDIKLDNGDEQKLLGTGSIDYTLKLDWQYYINDWTPSLTVGSVLVGDSELFDSSDYYYTQAGLYYTATETLTLGAGMYLGFLKNDTDIKQLEYSLSYQFSESGLLNLSYQNGLSNTAIDNGWSLALYGYF